MENTDILILILSIGFIILIIFVCVAIGTMIKVMLDIKKITEIAKREAESVADKVDAIGDRAKNFFTNTMVIEKIIPSLLGAISFGLGAKKTYEEYKAKSEKTDKGSDKKKKKKNKIFSEEEID
ncbi:MAG: hypothetical protein PHU42_02525 [Patescibacteria group bacterium]|nr:hypothetical protein [Patescibacteria group bacterium]